MGREHDIARKDIEERIGATLASLAGYRARGAEDDARVTAGTMTPTARDQRRGEHQARIVELEAQIASFRATLADLPPPTPEAPATTEDRRFEAAKAAMQGLAVSCLLGAEDGKPIIEAKEIAAAALAIGDALIAALAKAPTGQGEG